MRFTFSIVALSASFELKLHVKILITKDAQLKASSNRPKQFEDYIELFKIILPARDTSGLWPRGSYRTGKTIEMLAGVIALA